MAKVMALLRVLPADVDVDIEKLRKRIEEAIAKLGQGYMLQSYRVEPIAFGLNALKILILMREETEGGTYSLEEAIKSIEGVGEVEVEFVSRLS